MAGRYPAEHGGSANSGPEIDAEPDAAGWLQAKGLQQHQLRDMFANPAEEIAAALLSEASVVVRNLLQSGFQPASNLASAFAEAATSPQCRPSNRNAQDVNAEIETLTLLVQAEAVVKACHTSWRRHLLPGL